MKLKPIFYQKIILIFFGLLLSFIVLEVGLRLAGFTLAVLQENRNHISLRNGGDYRILCLGESTTQGQYPPFLEASLNKNNRDVKFTVFDKGKVGTNTTALLKEVEASLDKYHPDMVVAMMGINDGRVPHVPYDDPSASTTILFLRFFKTYKLARLLWLHIVAGAKALDPSGVPFGALQTRDAYPKNERVYVELGRFYRERGELAQAEVNFKEALELNPRNDAANAGLGLLYTGQGLYAAALAEASFKKALELNPNNDEACAGLGWVYKAEGRFAQAEVSFNKALKLNPRNDAAYLGLGWVYGKQGRFAEAEASLKKALELDPHNEEVYVVLGEFYRHLGRLKQAERYLRKGLEYSDARASYQLYGELSATSERGGQITQAHEYFDKARELAMNENGSASDNLPTAHNYRALKVMLDKRKIRLVCVQYPTRPLEPLKKIFAGQGRGPIFVDNETIFRDAIGQNGVNVYFKDMFGGSFGHCTGKGNQLLGENIAKVILGELFGK